MRKETQKKGKITELNIGKDVDIAIKEFDDGTADYILHFKDLKLKEKLEHDAKEAGVTPEGYVLASIFYKDQERLKEIVDKYRLKNT